MFFNVKSFTPCLNSLRGYLLLINLFFSLNVGDRDLFYPNNINEKIYLSVLINEYISHTCINDDIYFLYMLMRGK